VAPLALATLVAAVYPVFVWIALREGLHTDSAIQKNVYQRFYTFMLVQVLL
jgi:hypothetical protein